MADIKGFVRLDLLAGQGEFGGDCGLMTLLNGCIKLPAEPLSATKWTGDADLVCSAKQRKRRKFQGQLTSMTHSQKALDAELERFRPGFGPLTNQQPRAAVYAHSFGGFIRPVGPRNRSLGIAEHIFLVIFFRAHIPPNLSRLRHKF